MTDERLKLLAKNLIEYSVGLKEGESILIELIGQEIELAKELVKLSYSKRRKTIFVAKTSHCSELCSCRCNRRADKNDQQNEDLMEKWMHI